MKQYIGIDLGGTQVRAGLVDEKGSCSAIVKTHSHPEKGAAAVADTIADLVHQLDGWQSAAAAGICLPGILNPDHDGLLLANNLPLLVDQPFAHMMEERLGMPVVLGNDGKTAALAEALAGAGKGKDHVYYITLSTGIGSAFVDHGQVLYGRGGYAGEVGNLPLVYVDENGAPAVGTLESLCAGPALVQQAHKAGLEDVRHAGHVFALANQACKPAQAIKEAFIENTALALASAAHLLDPDVIVLSGGLMLSADDFLPALKSRYNALVFENMRSVPFVKASLPEPGVVGAAMLPCTQGL